jgi:hypothetical protein
MCQSVTLAHFFWLNSGLGIAPEHIAISLGGVIQYERIRTV